MKRVFAVIILLVLSFSGVSAQESLKDVVKEFQDNNKEFVLVIPSFLIKMGLAFGDMDEDEREILSQIHNMKIVISDHHFKKDDFVTLDDGIKSGAFQEVMTVHEGDEKVRMVMSKKSKRKSEMLVLVEGKEENLMMLFNFYGEPDFSKLISLAN